VRSGLLASLLIAMAVAPPVTTNQVAPALRTVLAKQLKFSARELGDLERGAIVTRTLGESDPGEIAVVAAAWIDASMPEFLTAFRDIVHFKQGEQVVQIGTFSDPPVVADVAPLTITPDDFDGKACHVGDCAIRLPADAIRKVEHDVDWRAPDADARASELLKQMIVDDVRAYWSGAPGRFVEYNDGKKPIRPLDDLAGVLRASPYIDALAPGLGPHLARFPQDRLEGADDFLYWSKEKFGFTPFITVTHVTIVHAASGNAVITTKDVYSSRYFDTSLGLTIASDAAQGGHGFFLVYVNRSRANALKGRFSGLRRSIVERRAAGSMEESLKTVKARLEKSR
jgi:hypothetical protein